MIQVKRIVNSSFSSNTYIVSKYKYDNIWLIDPGDTEAVFEWMATHFKNTVTGVLLTHSHFDHFYGVNEILNYYSNCLVYVANDYGKEALKDPKINGSRYTGKGPIIISDNADICYYGKTMQLWTDVDMQTINTQGHSPDSQCLLLEGMLFTGDTLIKDVRTVTKLKGGSVEKLEESIKIIESLKGQHLIVMPGHGEEFELDEYDLSKMKSNPLK
jgi:glyoxylase-like metal-dependent hydrolase (beta-lactamase superfamily II)